MITNIYIILKEGDRFTLLGKEVESYKERESLRVIQFMKDNNAFVIPFESILYIQKEIKWIILEKRLQE